MILGYDDFQKQTDYAEDKGKNTDKINFKCKVTRLQSGKTALGN